jgi:hypothetical protein
MGMSHARRPAKRGRPEYIMVHGSKHNSYTHSPQLSVAEEQYPDQNSDATETQST